MKIIEILSFIFSLIAMQLYVVHRQSIREIRGWVEDVSIPHHLLRFKLHCQAHELEQRRLAKKSLDFLWKKDVYIQAGFFAKTKVWPPIKRTDPQCQGIKSSYGIGFPQTLSTANVGKSIFHRKIDKFLFFHRKLQGCSVSTKFSNSHSHNHMMNGILFTSGYVIVSIKHSGWALGSS